MATLRHWLSSIVPTMAAERLICDLDGAIHARPEFRPLVHVMLEKAACVAAANKALAAYARQFSAEAVLPALCDVVARGAARS